MNQHNSDNIYLNITVNNTSGDPLAFTPAVYNVTYANPIIEKPSDYYMTVVKFEIPLQDLPLFVMPIVPDQPDPTLTPFQVGVCQQQDLGGTPNASAVNFPISVVFEPQVYNLPVNDPTTYYVYSYGHLIDMLNVALRASWVAAGSPGGGTNFPYYVYDESDNKIKVIMPYSFVHAAAAAGFHWTVFNNVNAQLALFSFNDVQNNGRFEIWTPPAEYDNSYIAQAPYPVVAGNVRGAGLTYIFSQEYQTSDYINSIRKIVITTTSIPIQKEFFPQPGNTNLSNTNSVGIITDFYLDLANRAGAQRSVAIYTSDIYRLIDLISDNPMRRIDIGFFWSDRLNNLYPITLSVYDSISLKLGFFSKKLYRNQELKYI